MLPVPDAQLYAILFDGALVAVGVVALLTTLKQAVRALRGAWVLNRGGWQAFLYVAPVLVGALLGTTPGIFDSYAPGMRLLLGAVSGFASPTIYGVLKERLAGLLVSGGLPDRAPASPGASAGPVAPSTPTPAPRVTAGDILARKAAARTPALPDEGA